MAHKVSIMMIYSGSAGQVQRCFLLFVALENL